ncbi:uncharacterized protein LOC128864629 [Anastrepha ludens]|uniref:uncharacterized protein LOC128864629 n=1 Tax=Anastrepha ludens TaxID=28586 RepID=UPI0023AF9EC3|nr:uncharacterized protein LOC128864629 [Anastrepha ludens]
MNKPPDNKVNLPPNLPALKWDKTKQSNFTSNEPVYLLMPRPNNSDNLKNVSPFLIQKAINSTCGEVEYCKKIISGQILIKTKNGSQANKLTTLTALSNTIIVEITPHKTLNYSKGVIYCNELRSIPESEILDELKPQNVCEVKKILKKVNNDLIETGLIILTFATTTLPTKIHIGYIKTTVRPYIPPPMRCKNCFKFNHVAKFCKSPKSCHNCASNNHVNDENQEKCNNITKCGNCDANGLTCTNHTTLDKKCPIFIREKEIQTIKITSQVDNKTARAIYKERHPHNNYTFAEVTSQHTSKQTTLNSQSEHQNSPHFNHPLAVQPTKPPTKPTAPTTNSLTENSMERQIMQYSDVMSESETDDSLESTSTSKQKIKILPKNTSKRLQSQIKKLNKKK